MAAMTEDQELQVLEELKNYLDITWDDPGVKKKLLGMIRKQSEECCTTVRQPDLRLNQARKKKISNLAQKKLRSITHHLQTAA